MKSFECSITDKSHGVQLISLVENPANKFDMIPVCQGLEACHLSNGNEFIVPVLVPEQKILRQDKDKEFYDISFNEDAIKAIFVDFMQRKRLSSTDIDHDGKILNKKMIFLEMWVKESETDKSIRFFDKPIGTWFTKLKVLDHDLIKKIENGEIKGVSIYGDFDHKLNINKNQLEMAKESEKQGLAILQKLKALVMEETPKPEEKEAPEMEARIKALEDAITEILDMLAKKEPTKEELEDAEKSEKSEKLAESEKKDNEEKEDEKKKVEMSFLVKQIAALNVALSKVEMPNVNQRPEPKPEKAAALDLNQVIQNNKRQ